jgi:hypothetical protein
MGVQEAVLGLELDSCEYELSMRSERGGVTLCEISSLGLDLDLVDECGSANYGIARERGGWRGRRYVGLERVREAGIRLREIIQPCMIRC